MNQPIPSVNGFRPGFDDLPPMAKYQRLAHWLEQQIRSGTYPPESTLPTEEALCREFKLSRGTVQQAINGLVQKGLVRREQGRGSFVNPARRADVSSFMLRSFDDMVRSQGRTPSTRLLAAATHSADPATAAQLAIEVGAPVLQIERLRFADGVPIAHEERVIAAALCPDLLSHDLEGDSLHRLLVEHYQLPLVRMAQVIELVAPPAPISALLHSEREQTLFFVDRLTFTSRDGVRLPAVWFRGYYSEATLPLTATVAP